MEMWDDVAYAKKDVIYQQMGPCHKTKNKFSDLYTNEVFFWGVLYQMAYYIIQTYFH